MDKCERCNCEMVGTFENFYGCYNGCGNYFYICEDCATIVSIYQPIFKYYTVYCRGCLRELRLKSILDDI